jgi:hypothetical protein
VSVVVAGYLCFYASSIISALFVVHTRLVLPPTDFGSWAGVTGAARDVGEIAGAPVLLFLVCRWLDIGWSVARLPRRGCRRCRR